MDMVKILEPLSYFILLGAFFLIFLRVLKVFDESLDESDTERQVKTSAGISEERHLIMYLLSNSKISPLR